jgi:hypothetical protein
MGGRFAVESPAEFAWNTHSGLLNRQIQLERADRGNVYDSPYLPDILEKIKVLDGVDRDVQAFMDRYDLTHVEADRWTRYLRQQWEAHEADFLLGETAQLDANIPTLLGYPDQALYFDTEKAGMNAQFVQYVEQLIE